MEISIQLWKINPCCPGTKYPLGDARKEKVADVLQRVSKMEVFQQLNLGEPWQMGKHVWHIGGSGKSGNSSGRKYLFSLSFSLLQILANSSSAGSSLYSIYSLWF